MQRSNITRAFFPLVLTLSFAACSSPTDVGDSHRIAPESPALAEAPDEPPAPPVSTVTPLPGGGFRFTSTAVLDVPTGAAWAKLHNIEKTVEIALPGIATDFQWLDGGGPSTVPSQFQFSALGATVVEEVFFVDTVAKVLKYRLVIPALGLQSYAGTIDLDRLDNTHTKITFSRDATFDDPASVDAFADLFHQEAVTIQTYFAGSSH
jgi:hypothetical protein